MKTLKLLLVILSVAFGGVSLSQPTGNSIPTEYTKLICENFKNFMQEGLQNIIFSNFYSYATKTDLTLKVFSQQFYNTLYKNESPKNLQFKEKYTRIENEMGMTMFESNLGEGVVFSFLLGEKEIIVCGLLTKEVPKRNRI